MRADQRLKAAYATTRELFIARLDKVCGTHSFVLATPTVHFGKGVASVLTRDVSWRLDKVELSFRWRAQQRDVALSLSAAVRLSPRRIVEVDSQNAFVLLGHRRRNPVLTDRMALSGPPGTAQLLRQLEADLAAALQWWNEHYSTEEAMLGRLRADDRNGVGANTELYRAMVKGLEATIATHGHDPAAIMPSPIREASPSEKARATRLARWIEAGGSLIDFLRGCRDRPSNDGRVNRLT